jgi:hypothetical protein
MYRSAKYKINTSHKQAGVINTAPNERVPVFEERDARVIGHLQGNCSTNKNGNL